MTKIIDVLEQIGSDASLNNGDTITNFLTTTEISDDQKQAILGKDCEQLVTTISDLPEIKCFAVLPAEDDDQEEDKSSETSDQLTAAVAVNI